MKIDFEGREQKIKLSFVVKTKGDAETYCTTDGVWRAWTFISQSEHQQ